MSTGKRLWEVPAEEAVELAAGVPRRRGADAAADAGVRASGQRMWGDMTYGTLSSDGRYVFSIEGLELELGLGRCRMVRQCHRLGETGVIGQGVPGGEQ